MYVYSSIKTFYGRRLAAEPNILAAILTDTERTRLAAELDREADMALAEGRVVLADRLSWRAAGLREAHA